jgi:predicted choloylglycine hydrolase
MKKRFYRRKVFLIPVCAVLLVAVGLAGLYYFRTPLLLALLGTDAHPVVVVSGTWEEMGYQLGSRVEFAQSIRRTASFQRGAVPLEKAKLYFEKAEPLLPKSALEQMKGLARGVSEALSISFEDAWGDILVWNFFVPNTYIKGCTAFAVTTPKGRFLAHNTDLEYIYNLGGAVIIFKPDPGLGYPYVSFFSPGFVGVAMGENSAGLAVVYNAAFPSRRDYGLPPLMMVRKIMRECGSLDEVVRTFQSFLDEGGRFAHNGANLLFMDFNAGQMARVELASDRVEVDRGMTWEEKHFVLQTNHYCLMPERNKREEDNTSSYARFERAKMLLKVQEDFTVESVLKMLSDHDGEKQGHNHTICRHKNINVGTNNTLVFDDQFTLYYLLGNPCRYGKNPKILQVVRWKELLEKS